MKRKLNTKRTMSAIVALALAAAVTLTAGIESYEISNNEENVMFDLEASLERAYNDVTMDDFDAELATESYETIKVYDSEDNLVRSIVLTDNEVIEDVEAKKLLNRAEFLTSYNNTSLYRIN
ncbi:hypothetical protein [Roseivirga sp. E12]|uniref:hypothetical protein n=1 Tax=Roseivirga sp. E12 TaxID=2819237 RepID=UPI001ABC777E|nr:hypothetical protein [Roseivirga sp. E12]MBO3700457.1 hypothetical protein [Roseivirga sp. E12]